jgi:hypothetical protein
MSTRDQLVIENKIEELASRYRAEGYRVTPHPSDNPEVGLVVEKNGTKIAFDVRTQEMLGRSREKIRAIRQKAAELGYTETRLVVAHPPRKVIVSISSLDDRLFRYLEANIPPEIARLTPKASVTDVSHLEFAEAEVTPASVHVSGEGVIDVELFPNGAGMGEEWDFPFSFDVELDRDLTVSKVRSIRVDTSDFEQWS